MRRVNIIGRVWRWRGNHQLSRQDAKRAKKNIGSFIFFAGHTKKAVATTLMAIVDRIIYALIGGVFGALIGVACWWLYGLAHSLNYSGPGMDPVLRHWVTYVGGTFALIGFLFLHRVADVLGDTINAIFHFEGNQAPNERSSPVVALVFIAIIIAAIWFTVPA